MDDKKAVHHADPNIEVVKHHKDSLPSWDELKYFIRKYYLFLLIIALIPVVLFTLGQQLANRGSAAPRLRLNSGGKVGVQTESPLPFCTLLEYDEKLCFIPDQKVCQTNQKGLNTGAQCTCTWAGNYTVNNLNCSIYVNSCVSSDQCPLPTPLPVGKCAPNDQKLFDRTHCGTKPDGSEATCQVCQSNGMWSESYDLDCPSNERAVYSCLFPTLTPNPQGGGGAPPPGGGGNPNEQCQPGSWEAPKNCWKRGCSPNESARCKDDGSGWECVGNPSLCG